ncbi:hypothetical protein HER32_04055 [Hymenobacter sp. BT18]|uniref:hypothetical protein n=1 Tax=Hymenobacter sp. BT18 TaxID=2835648 RepID=UPI00143EA0EC|nr:hypothetical protein [Hymenobacter sp. BT18]QIX60404.1 hypothetical protein HER32_04055 [Hymenobacter sp. BT18]
MSVPYHALFLLEADTAFIFEIKRLDVQSTDPADVYFWLRFDKATQALELLTFEAMSAADGEQRRQFSQGQLRFSAAGGTFTPATDGPALALRPHAPPKLPAALEQALFAFFDKAESPA